MILSGPMCRRLRPFSNLFAREGSNSAIYLSNIHRKLDNHFAGIAVAWRGSLERARWLMGQVEGCLGSYLPNGANCRHADTGYKNSIAMALAVDTLSKLIHD